MVCGPDNCCDKPFGDCENPPSGHRKYTHTVTTGTDVLYLNDSLSVEWPGELNSLPCPYLSLDNSVNYNAYLYDTIKQQTMKSSTSH